jgi:hypothetical protein
MIQLILRSYLETTEYIVKFIKRARYFAVLEEVKAVLDGKRSYTLILEPSV